jgi:hypothetical protein
VEPEQVLPEDLALGLLGELRVAILVAQILKIGSGPSEGR